MFWPSFNSAVTAHGDDQHRTAMNTYYSLAACTLATYGMSAVTAHDGKLDMVRTHDYDFNKSSKPYDDMVVCYVNGLIHHVSS